MEKELIELHKGNKIIGKLKTKAIHINRRWDRKKSESDVFITQGCLIDKQFKGLILSIDDTPGAWYIDTLFHWGEPAIHYNEISINGNWICINWQEIVSELKIWLKENNYLVD